MKWLSKKWRGSSKGLRYKLMLAFSIMSVIPLLACTYLISNYIFPQLKNITDVSAIMFAVVVISIAGFGLAKKLVEPVIDMALEAKIIASGEYDRKIVVASDDEIGNLGESINVMTQRIKNNLDELKNYGQKTREINVEIHKKILALSSLLQIGEIISTGTVELDTVMELSVQKVAMLFDTGFGVLYISRPKSGDFVPKVSYNIESEKLIDVVINENGQSLLEKVFQDRSVLVIDDGVKGSKVIDDFKQSYNVKNILAVPVYSGKKNLALLVLGSRMSNFKFKVDDIDLVKVFTKQITIAIENDTLVKRAEELAIVDELTGLYNKNYLLTRLEEEIKRSIFYQRPCSFIVVNVDNFVAFRDSKGELIAEEFLKKIGKLIKDNAMPMSKVGRIGGDEFAVLLPEKNKKEAAAIAEDIRRRVEMANFGKEGSSVNLTVSSGVSENPIDGSTREELFKKAIDALHVAKKSGKNKVSL
ncbi:MAG: diguanylate cyclase [Candidatus Omnitrophota bacterium]|jgi:diguanylate cyclase (GGDEF)-like protein